jgi:hypothetical protein
MKTPYRSILDKRHYSYINKLNREIIIDENGVTNEVTPLVKYLKHDILYWYIHGNDKPNEVSLRLAYMLVILTKLVFNKDISFNFAKETIIEWVNEYNNSSLLQKRWYSFTFTKLYKSLKNVKYYINKKIKSIILKLK